MELHSSMLGHKILGQKALPLRFITFEKYTPKNVSAIKMMLDAAIKYNNSLYYNKVKHLMRHRQIKSVSFLKKLNNSLLSNAQETLYMYMCVY